MRRPRHRAVEAALAIGVALTACVEPPPPVERVELPEVAPLDAPEVAATSILRRAQQVTVRIRSLGCEHLGLGSGFVLPGGVVVTNRHVLEQPLQVSVNTWDGHRLDADVAGVAIDSDLAVLQLDDTSGLPTAELRTEPVEVGERIYAVGYPGGGPAAVTEGEVVALVDGSLLGESTDVIRIDAEIRQGNSGGPVLDERGQVVGVVFALETTAGTGLAVPAATLLERLDDTELAQPGGC